MLTTVSCFMVTAGAAVAQVVQGAAALVDFLVILAFLAMARRLMRAFLRAANILILLYLLIQPFL